MTRKELEQLRCLKNEIKLLEKDKYLLSGQEQDGEKRGRQNRKIDRKVSELQDEIGRLEEYIDTIPDSEMRQIIRLRYRNGLSWQQIAFQIGKYDESYPRRKHKKFLKLAENAEK